MSSEKLCYWKRLWRWVHSDALGEEDVKNILHGSTKEQLKLGLASYKPLQTDRFTELEKKHSDQSKLLSATRTLQSFLNLDTFQTWDVLMHYLCEASYGAPTDVLKNAAYLDIRTSDLLPKVFHFYHVERLFLLKFLKDIIERKDDINYKYHEQYSKIVSDIGIQQLKTSMLSQFNIVLESLPPSRTTYLELEENTFKTQWIQYNLWEQVEILQILILLVDEVSLADTEFLKLFNMFKKHDFASRQMFNDSVDLRHKETCLRITLSEIALFLVAADAEKIKEITCWIEASEDSVESELTKLQPREEFAPMLLAWMLITLESEKYKMSFEQKYQHFGVTALRLQVFKFLNLMITNTIFKDNSKVTTICRKRIFALLNTMCDKFDGDGSISLQPGVMELCGELLSTPDMAKMFWSQYSAEYQQGVVSLWNTALEYFPHNFNALSILAAGLAKAGSQSVEKLMLELKSLPVYTEIFNPNTVRITNKSVETGEVIIANDHYPMGSSYKIPAGSSAAIMERSDGTYIHFRTPVSYWVVLGYEMEKVLDKKVSSQQEVEAILNIIWAGTKVLKEVLQVLAPSGQLPRSLVWPSEASLEVLLRFHRLHTPPLPLLVSCLQTCTALVKLFPAQVHARLVNTGLLPRLGTPTLSHAQLAAGHGLDPAAMGAHLVTLEQDGAQMLLAAYLDLLTAFCENSPTEKILIDIFLSGVVFVLREVFPNLSSWRYSSVERRRSLTEKCIHLLTLALELPASEPSATELLIQKTCVYSLLHLENSVELLKIVSVGDNHLQQIMCNETNWNSGPGVQYLSCMQRSLALLIQILRLKTLVTDANELTPIEHLIFAQTKESDPLKVVPNVTSYINHAFNQHLPALTCRLLNRLASEFQMSLFACLDISAHQARVMFLDRLRDKYESTELKIAILVFVATCVSTQPGVTEAFFKLSHGQKQQDKGEDKSEGILAYMADYLANVKTSSSCLYSPLLSCVMALFHALWKNNMQILIKDLTENPKFWEHMTSPLFNDIQPELRAYAQIFNVLSIELFVRRENVDPNLKQTLEKFFNTDNKHLDKWIDYVFSFDGRFTTPEKVDEVPTWLGLLTSWKDFTTIFCKCLPFPLNIAHKFKMVSPCMKALLKELEDARDSRLVIILSELYVIMLANWNEDCFDNRKVNVKEIDQLLISAGAVYESLHPRAKRAILCIATVAISSLDYEIKANAQLAQSIVRSVTNINSWELDALYDEIRESRSRSEKKLNGHVNRDMAPVVLSLAALEQCLDLYDDMFSSLAQWFQSTRFVNKLLCCLQVCIQSRKHYHTSLAALRCLTSYARGPFSKDLLFSDMDQFLWLQMMPPKDLNSEKEGSWKPQEWWKVYAHGLELIACMVRRHGHYFAGAAILFAGVHAEQLSAAVLLARHSVEMEALDLCAAAVDLVRELVRYQDRWKMENDDSLTLMMRSMNACVHDCVSLALRFRLLHQMVERPGATDEQPAAPSDKVARTLNRILEIIHSATLALLRFSPDLLELLAGWSVDVERWRPLVALQFGAPKISYEPAPHLSFGTLLSAVALLAKSLNHTYHAEDASSPSRSRSPRAISRRRCSCSSPGARADSVTSVSSTASAVPAPWLAAFDKLLVSNTLEAVLTLVASQALLTVKDPAVATRDKQLVRRELGSELTVFHDFVRKRILPSRNVLVRNKLGVWPLVGEDSIECDMEEDQPSEETKEPLPPPPPPKRSAHDSMREFILRKQYLKATSTPVKRSDSEDFSSPVGCSTPTASERRKETKRVSWAETSPPPTPAPPYYPLTHVQIGTDDDYLHFLSVLLLYISQSDQ